MNRQNLVEQLASLYHQFDVVDLSPLLENGVPRYPRHPHVVIHPTVTHEHDGYYCQTLFLPEHAASHVDAPAHTNASMMQYTIDTYPPDVIVGPAVVMDLTYLDLKAGELLSADQVLAWESKSGVRLSSGDIVLFNFDWMRRYWRTDGEWLWYAQNSPGIDEDVCKLLLERKVKAIGADTIAADQANLNGVVVNRYGHRQYLLPNQVFIIECLCNLDRLPPRCFFVALPLKIKAGSGSPIRAMALIPRS